MEHDLLVRLLEERAAQGCYASVQDLVRGFPRSGTDAFAGSDRSTSLHEEQEGADVEVHLLLGVPLKPFRPKTLFDTPLRPFRLPELDQEAREDAYDQIELLGFPLCDFFLLYKTEGEGIASSDLKYLRGRSEGVGLSVTAKQTRTAQGKPMMFGNFLDQDGLFIDTVHFSEPQESGLSGKRHLLHPWKVIEEFGCCSIDV